jgi:hypothetical protein
MDAPGAGAGRRAIKRHCHARRTERSALLALGSSALALARTHDARAHARKHARTHARLPSPLPHAPRPSAQRPHAHTRLHARTHTRLHRPSPTPCTHARKHKPILEQNLQTPNPTPARPVRVGAQRRAARPRRRRRGAVHRRPAGAGAVDHGPVGGADPGPEPAGVGSRVWGLGSSFWGLGPGVLPRADPAGAVRGARCRPTREPTRSGAAPRAVRTRFAPLPARPSRSPAPPPPHPPAG